MSTRILYLIPALALLATACRKDKEDAPDIDFTSASDNARAEDAFSDMLAQVDKAVEDNGLRDQCDPVVTFDTTATPRTITLDFGDVNCTAANGRLRRGRILVSYTGRYREPGTRPQDGDQPRAGRQRPPALQRDGERRAHRRRRQLDLHPPGATHPHLDPGLRHSGPGG